MSLECSLYWVLSWVQCTSSGGSAPLILEASILPSGVNHLPLHKLSISSFSLFFLSFLTHHLYCLLIVLSSFTFGLYCFFILFLVFNFFQHHHLHTITVFSLLLSRREPSHLLNHLVKFVFSDNFLWAYHHILFNSKILNKVQPLKCAILKPTHIKFPEHIYFTLLVAPSSPTEVLLQLVSYTWLFVDLRLTKAYAWAAAMLTHMYEKLRDCSYAETRQLVGYATLWQGLIYKHFPL